MKNKPSIVLRRLARVFTARGALDMTDPYVTIVGVLLSARTRDEQVLRALPSFVRHFPRVEVLANADIASIRAQIATIGMNGQKAKHLKGMAQMIVQEYGGRVPSTMEELVRLPGVGRKTASVVLSAIFDTPAIAVDVHVHRVARRLGWSRAALPAGTEKDLLQLIPRNLQSTVNLTMVKLGRYICLPRKPRCAMCPLQDICPYQQKNTELPRDAAALEADWRKKEQIIKDLQEEVRQAMYESR